MVYSSVGVLLLAAVAGYWVLEQAAGHRGGDLRRIGKLLGSFIIIVSLLGVVCRVWTLATNPGYSHHGKKGVCQYHAYKSHQGSQSAYPSK